MTPEGAAHPPGPNRDPYSRLACVLLVASLSLLAAPNWADAVAGPHGTVELVAEQAALTAGKPFRVGLHFQLETGWHIYWINPGDSGEPPRVKWTLPPGFQAGALQWPVPRRIEDHSLIDYGYQNEVLLPVDIHPPDKPSGASAVQISATVNWLVCRDVCIPGRAVLPLTLHSRTGVPGPAAALFAQSLASLPKPAPKTWRLAAYLDGRRFVLKVYTGRPETAATFFPLEENQIENSAPQKATPLASGIQLELSRSDQLSGTPSHLTGVLVLASGQGYEVQAPVTLSP